MLRSISSTDVTPRPKKASTAPDGRREIPWPALIKLSPGKLVRTASTLMNEWERSLASPPAGTSASSTPSKATASPKAEKAY